MGELYRLVFSNGKSYVGITTRTAEQRFAAHRRTSKTSAKGVVYRAWRKYGAPALQLLAVVGEDDLYETERRAVSIFGTRYPKGYNMTDGGDIAPSLSPEVAKKISMRLRGRKIPEEQKRRQAATITGRKHTAAARERMSIAQKGKRVSLQARRNMSIAAKKRIATSETRRSMSEAQRKRRQMEGCTPQRWRYP